MKKMPSQTIYPFVFGKIIRKVSLYLNWIAEITIVLLMAIVVINSATSKFHMAILGTYEISSFFTAFVISLALADAALAGSNVSVDFVFIMLSKNTQRIIRILSSLICTFISSVMAYQLIVYAGEKAQKGEISETLHLPLSPIVYAMSLGFVLLALTYAVKTVEQLMNIPENGVITTSDESQEGAR